MIRYIEHDKIDRKRWDSCIWKSPNGLLYAFSWYLDMMCEEWDALVEDDYVSVFPLPKRKKYGIEYIYQPFFIQQLGLFSSQLMTPEKTARFIYSIPDNFKHIDINLNSFMKIPDLKKDYQCKENTNYVLELIHDYDYLKKNYSENLRRNLKKCGNKLKLQTQSKPEIIVNLFKENRGKERASFTDADYAKFVRLAHLCLYKRLGSVWTVYDETNSLLSGAIFFFFKGRTTMIFSATNQKGRERNAMHYLFDKFIATYQQHNMILDFEGSNDKNLGRFYKSFGSVDSPYYNLQYNKTSKLAQLALKMKRGFL